MGREAAVWVLLALLATARAHMDVVHSWRTVDYAFPSLVARDAMIRTGKFIPINIALIDMDVWDGGSSGQKIFVTAPRFKPGNPATLNTVAPNGALQPYPHWNWHREGNCDGITSVFRVDIDQCGRLWVLDSGMVDIFEKEPRMICPPQILVFNLNNDKLIGRYVFPSDVADSRSLLVTIAVDTRDPKCLDTFAYVADVTGYRLLVVDAVRQKSWRVTNNYFYPYPLHGSFNINGVSFDLMDGVIGLALGPVVNNDRRLYFHSLASVRESWVATSLLRNQTLFTEGDGAPRSFHVSQFTRSSQSAAEAMSPNGVLFFGLLSQNAIACWNSRLPYAPQNINIVAKDDNRLQFPSGIKMRNGHIWTVSTKFHNFITNQMDLYSANYRIMVAPVAVLTSGTSCHHPGDDIVRIVEPNITYWPPKFIFLK
ncbi:protein yellow isoform X2 [Halyomorpha halys]|uniref:protein yellow isoform X2 n=1 Tax=Halyomorpha halys TaxID=286706 RepID=UPI0006D4E0C7|nr:protein yellow-like isoform X2 [Halyomorpha halys]